MVLPDDILQGARPEPVSERTRGVIDIKEGWCVVHECSR
jgi:hypothetical protein